MVKHALTKVAFYLDTATQKAHAPHKTAHNHDNDNQEHGFANMLPHKVHIKLYKCTAYIHNSGVCTIDNHAVQLGNFKLEVVHGYQGYQTKQQCEQVLEVVPVDVFSKDHKKPQCKKVSSRQKTTLVLRHLPQILSSQP